MGNLFAQPLFYIYFIYGISFLIMANVIVGGVTGASEVALVSAFYLLVVFGILHGTTEMIDWARFIGKTVGVSESELLLYSSQIMLILSFVALLQFAVNLMTYTSEKKGLIRLLPLALFVVYIAAVFVLGISDIRQIGLIARYSFGFIGSALSAAMLFKLGHTMKQLGNPKLVRGLNVTGVGFACYALFGGLIVDSILGLPIQLFRAACAVTIAFASTSLIAVFKKE